MRSAKWNRGSLLMAYRMASRIVVMTFTDEVRDAIESSGLSRYRLSMESGVAQSVLSRFMNGTRGLSTETLDKLAVVLRMSVVSKGPTQAVRARQEGN